MGTRLPPGQKRRNHRGQRQRRAGQIAHAIADLSIALPAGTMALTLDPRERVALSAALRGPARRDETIRGLLRRLQWSPGA
jgi:hypothetical protein